jgi:hypothetical protein
MTPENVVEVLRLPVVSKAAPRSIEHPHRQGLPDRGVEAVESESARGVLRQRADAGGGAGRFSRPALETSPLEPAGQVGGAGVVG